MGLRDIGATLPPGFRFYPSDEELVCHYLYKKITNEEALRGTLVEINLHTCEPWQLPEVAKLNRNEWYFFSFQDRKYATGVRANRATIGGYWKATGKDRTVMNPKTSEVMGMRKTLVFYRKRAPNGIKTGWIMHEFRIQTPHMSPKADWVLCRVFPQSKRDEITTQTATHIYRPITFDAATPAPSSFYSLPSHVQFPPAADVNMLPFNNVNLEVEAEAGGLISNGVDDSTTQQRKFESEDCIQNGFFHFDYFVA
ncbi:NAC domain-containing protein 21/22-like [Momordica charantia]|uniref:NAC domain-containing protein 21/22-like n=1 Tax=Momordica charantia TaxID=3673 RepID=A0A6J1DP70_MOMCH|nr:NAC domain-containing protein 21/22-like [Momordica charantia]XP_022155090.1 NAC domain-containing protein 21/22-like [Momordica charantia]